jgi:hypothetical protein
VGCHRNPINTENQSCRYFLKFPTHPYTTYSGKQNQSYSDLKAGSKRRIQQKPGNRLGSGERIQFRSRTELRINWIRNEVWFIIFLDWAEFKAANLLVQFYLFGIGSVLNEQSLLNSKLTSNSTDLGKTYYTKVVDNFDTFPVSIDMTIQDKWLRSNEL